MNIQELSQKSPQINKIHLFNLDKDNFIDTLSKSMGYFSLDTKKGQKFSGTLNYHRLPFLELAQISINQSIIVKTEPQRHNWKFDIPIQGELIYHGIGDSLMSSKSAFKTQRGESINFKLNNNEDKVKLLCPIFNPDILSDYVIKITDGKYIIDNLELPQILPLDTPEGKSFLRTLNFLYNELEQQNTLLQYPLILTQFQDAIISMLFYTLCPQIFHPLHSLDKICVPKYIKLAQDFIHAHLKDPISVADIASAVGVSYSSLFKGFKKYLNTTPMKYIKSRRLECVHQLLLSSNSTNTNVTDIAFEFGFSNLGNFSVDYRRTFGESPSKTLRY